MATNAEEPLLNDSKEVTEEDLRDLKYGSADVETLQEEDEADESNETTEESEEAGEEDETNSDDQAEEEDETAKESDVSTFVKKFPNIKGDTPEEYIQNLEAAYDNSFAELHRLRQTQVAPKGDDVEESTTAVASDPVALFVKQKMDEEITTAWSDFSKQYSQVNDPAEYERFTQKVGILQKLAIAEGRFSPPKELYNDAAAALRWESENKVDSKDKLANALKDRAAVSKTSSQTKPKTRQSKVTDAMVAASRLMYPDKTDAEIREELEPYVQ